MNAATVLSSSLVGNTSPPFLHLALQINNNMVHGMDTQKPCLA